MSTLRPCPDCGRQVSPNALTCPGCGRHLRHSPTTPGTMFIAILIGCMIAPFALILIGSILASIIEGIGFKFR